jgi:large subunit ribosomal protein L17
MKHGKKNRILSRARSQRLSLLRGLTSDLLKHGSITTTMPKAKELRRYFEPLVTTARQGLTRHTRRTLEKSLRAPADMERLHSIAKLHATRPGGYVRITRLPTKRQDDATMARVDILSEDVSK